MANVFFGLVLFRDLTELLSTDRKLLSTNVH
jgi:hypothetical protein